MVYLCNAGVGIVRDGQYLVVTMTPLFTDAQCVIWAAFGATLVVILLGWWELPND